MGKVTLMAGSAIRRRDVVVQTATPRGSMSVSDLRLAALAAAAAALTGCGSHDVVLEAARASATPTPPAAAPAPLVPPSVAATQPPLPAGHADDVPVEPVADVPGPVRFAFYGQHAPPQVAGCPLVYPQSATSTPVVGVYHNQFTLTFARVALSEIAVDSSYRVDGAILRRVASGTVYAVPGREGDEETWVSSDGRCLVHVLRLTDGASAYDTQAAAVTLAPVR